MKAFSTLVGVGVAAAAAGLALPALAADTAAKPAPSQNCFFSNQWNAWHAPKSDVIYMRVNVKDIYEVDLSAGSSLLTGPAVHLVNRINGPDTICGPLDLDLSVVEDGGGIKEPLIAKSITKLTPQQIAAIPKKDLP